MASLPPGWKADYDGQRWFFTYGPTGQSQFQFPRPGNEFPDFYCCGGAAATLPAVELLPEEKLESEKQIRRMMNVNGAGAASSSEVVGDEKGGLSGRESPRREEIGDDDGSNVCFESFAAVKSRGRQGVGGSPRGRGVDDGVGIPVRTSMADTSEESAGEPVPGPSAIEGEKTSARPPSHGAVGSPAAIAIMSEPVLAVVETTPAAPLLGHQTEHPLVAGAHSPPSEIPIFDGLAIDSAQKALSTLSVVDIQELYSESTALCEHEINPPPVELPGTEGGWSEQNATSSLTIQDPVELPAYEKSSVSLKKESSTAGLELKSYAPITLVGDHAAASDAGPRKTIGAKSRENDRAGLPSQASRMSSKIPLEWTSPRDSVKSAPDGERSNRDIDHLVEMFGTERKDLTHFPSILRPGPRRSGQPSFQQPGPVVPALVTNTSHAARIRPSQPQEQHKKEKVEAGSVSARMPAMPPAPHPHDVQTPSFTADHEAPHPCGARQNRLPSSVNFVIPIQHISSAKPSSASDNSTADSPEYNVSASFASVTSSVEPPRTGGQASRCSTGLLPGRKMEQCGRPVDETAAAAARLANGRSDPKVSEWSWGYAR